MDAERVRAQLDRILASAPFADAERASRFLRFVVERALEGRNGEIKESVIAVEVLGRNTSFDSKIRSDRSSRGWTPARAPPFLLRRRRRSGPCFDLSAEGRVRARILGAAVVRGAKGEPQCCAFPSCRLKTRLSSLLRYHRMAASSRSPSSLNGKLMLWVRALDSLEAKPLAGTDIRVPAHSGRPTAGRLVSSLRTS